MLYSVKQVNFVI